MLLYVHEHVHAFSQITTLRYAWVKQLLKVRECALWHSLSVQCDLCSRRTTPLGNSLRLPSKGKTALSFAFVPTVAFHQIWRRRHSPIPAVALTLWGPPDPSWVTLSLLLWGGDLMWHALWDDVYQLEVCKSNSGLLWQDYCVPEFISTRTRKTAPIIRMILNKKLQSFAICYRGEWV